MDFSDNAWEQSLLTTMTIDFQVKTTFTSHLNTLTLRSRDELCFLNGVAILIRRHHVTINLEEAKQVLSHSFYVYTF